MTTPGAGIPRDNDAVHRLGKPAMEVRPLLVADLEPVVELERCCYAVPWSRAMLLGELLRADGVQLGAFREGDLLGALIAARLGGPWHLMNVSVDPGERRSGIATTLIDAFFERAAVNDVEGYTLEVRAGNAAAIGLYERHSFARAGVRRRYYPDGEDGVVMWRPPQRVLDLRARRPQAAGARWQPAT